MDSTSERQMLVDNLLDAVKQCQIRFGGRAELATDLDERVSNLLKCLEELFSHGLKKTKNLIYLTKQVVNKSLPKSMSLNLSNPPNLSPESSVFFWHFVRSHLTHHEYERYLFLKNVHSDYGRGKAWLRSTLNERSLERYVLMMLDNTLIRSQFYEEWALLRDEERNSVLPTIARGLASILFAINIDDPDLDKIPGTQPKAIDIKQENDPLPVIASSLPSTNQKKFRKPPKINVISLCDENDDSFYHAQSAPSTCLPSPGSNDNISDGSQNEFSENDFNQLSNDLEVVGLENINSKVILTPIGENFDSSLNLNLNLNLDQDDNSDRQSSNDQNESIKKSDNFDSSSYKRCDSELSLGQNTGTRENIEELKIEFDFLKNEFQEKVSLYEFQIDFLKKENSLLKVQLKKYIAAVQMLKHNENSMENSSESLNQKLQNSPSYIYYLEVNEYEKKLVQVAEMHGELVEFNDHLQKVIQQKDSIINKLREELVELRGPLPDDEQTLDDTISIASEADLSLSSQHNLNRRLINIWVPTAFLAGGQKNNSYHVYQIYIRIKDEEWNVYRRYSQFHALHKSLRKKYPTVNTFEFPPKKTLGNKDSKVVQERRKKLEHYLRSLVNMLQTKHKDFNDKEHLISLLPFLSSEQTNQKDANIHSDSQTNMQNSSNSQHYSGL